MAEENEKVPQPEEEVVVAENDQGYESYSEGDQYDSDVGDDYYDDKNNLDRKPFK